MANDYKLWVRNKTDDGWINVLTDTNIKISSDGASSGQFASDLLDEVLLELKDLAGGGAPGYAGTPIHIINTDDVTSATDETGSFSTRGGMALAKSVWIGTILDVAGTSTFNDDVTLVGADLLLDQNIIGAVSITGAGTGNLTGFVGATLTGDLSVVNVTATGDLAGVNANLSGLTSTDTLLVSTSIDGNLVPTNDAAQFIGGPSNKWNSIYVNTLNADTVNSTSFTGVFTGTLNGNVVGDVAGNVAGNLDGDLIGSPTVTVTSNQGSTSITTGALVVEGGMGVVENLYLGGNLVVSGTISGGAAVDWSSIPESILPDTDATWDLGSGTFQWKDLYLSGALTANVTGDLIGDLLSPTVTVTSVTGSTSASTGALVVAGGMGVQENLYVGGNISGSSNLSSLSSSFQSTQVTGIISSTDKDTGALIITNGGLGVEENLNVGGDLSVTGAFSVGSFAISEVTGDLIGNVLSEDGLVIVLENGIDGSDAVFVGNVTGDLTGNVLGNVTGNLDGDLVNITTVYVTNAIDSTDKDTGALVIEGGVGIEKSLNVGGDISFNGTMLGNFVGSLLGDVIGNTQGDLNGDLVKSTSVYCNSATPATALGEGALVISGSVAGPNGGGLSVEGNVFVGGVLSTTGISTVWQQPLEAELLIGGYQYLIPVVDGGATPVTTLTLPATPVVDDKITLKDLDGVWNTSPVTIDSNGQSIEGVIQDLVLNVTNSYLELVFTDSQGWKII